NNVVAHKTTKGVSKKAVTKDVNTQKIDDEVSDPQMCKTYVEDIHDYLRDMEMEVKIRPLPDYIKKVQKDVSVNMRGVLVDWLVEVSEEYNLLPESLKYEEIRPPHTEDFCDITDNTYTKEDVVRMEAEVLKTLKFEMGNPTVKTFLGRFIRIEQEESDTPNMHLEFSSYYLAELSLLEYICVKFLPSMVAASVTFLARFILKPKSHPLVRIIMFPNYGSRLLDKEELKIGGFGRIKSLLDAIRITSTQVYVNTALMKHKEDQNFSDRVYSLYVYHKGDILLVQVYVDDIIFGLTKKELRFVVMDIAQKDKNKAKQTKPSTGMERTRKTEAGGAINSAPLHTAKGI
ncbi:G2/mitotic-specific cyclin C13-1-like protein, partial [Tanacetum coccineum]